MIESGTQELMMGERAGNAFGAAEAVPWPNLHWHSPTCGSILQVGFGVQKARISGGGSTVRR